MPSSVGMFFCWFPFCSQIKGSLRRFSIYTLKILWSILSCYLFYIVILLLFFALKIVGSPQVTLTCQSEVSLFTRMYSCAAT
ncbi:hypothetical protein OIU78_007336 [Salix suchowensis]|nr:hypothetical protein OIU78_007336 [Salix suchowensis]